jgi:hypothetical protein
MKSIKCYFTPFLALATVCNLLPAGSIALTGNAEDGLIVEESFEMGASFVADATHTAAYSTTDAVAWNDAIQALSQLSYTPILCPLLQKFLKHICLGLFSVLFSSKW